MTSQPTLVVVLAGGRATRLGERAHTVPKALQPVAGRPFLDVMLGPPRAQGFRRFHFCLGHLAEAVVRHLDEVHSATLTVTTSVETTTRGTAGALVDALPWLDETFLVLLGDTYAPLDYRALVAGLPHDADALVAVTRSLPDVPANMRLSAGRITAYDKHRGVPGGVVDTGVAVVRRRAVEAFRGARTPLDLASVFELLLNRGRLAGIDVAEQCFDIGTPARLDLLESHLKAQQPC